MIRADRLCYHHLLCLRIFYLQKVVTMFSKEGNC